MAAAEPQTLRSLAHHVRTAAELDKRDPVTAYYCHVFVMQTAMKIDSRSPESRKFLGGLMDNLEKDKKELADREEVHDEVVGQCHVENYSLRKDCPRLDTVLYCYGPSIGRQPTALNGTTSRVGPIILCYKAVVIFWSLHCLFILCHKAVVPPFLYR